MPSRTIALSTDLHARPAREVAEAADSFEADVVLVQDDTEARVTSPLELTALGAEHGDEGIITADGPDAEKALDAVVDVLAEQAPAVTPQRDDGGQDR